MILNVFFQMFSPRLGFLQSTNKSTEEHKVNHQTSATAWGENKFLCPAPCADSHSWHWRATATHQSPHWGFLKYACASDNHLEISQATRKWIKDSSSPACYVCVRQVNSLIRPRQGQSSGASCWQCCVGYERSPEEQTPSATALFFQPKQLLLFFQDWVAAFLWLFLSAKCWRALKCHTTIILNEAPVCVFRRPHLDMLRGANNTPQTCWDNTACAHNCECLQANCQECLARVGKGKESWDTLFSGELTDVGVAALHLWLFWDPNFCLSRAQPKTYDPLYCCFPLSIRQALKKTFQDMSWKYFLMFEWKLSFKVIYSFGLLFF